MNRVIKQLSLLGVVATLALVFAGVAEAGKTTLTVDVNEASFDFAPAVFGGVSFNIVGTIEGGGTFRCWGWIDAAGIGSVSQVYNIPGRGTIMTQGVEGGLLAVTGGTGDFSNVRGDALQVFTGNGFDFTMEFTLKGRGL
jgi:hypothetical protein